MAVVVRVGRLGVGDEGGRVLRHAVVVRVADRARMNRHVRGFERAVRVRVHREEVDRGAAGLIDEAVAVEVQLLRRDQVQLDPVRVLVLDRVQDDAVQGREGMVLRMAVAVRIDEGLGLDREGGLLENAVRVLVEGLQAPVEARPVFRDAVLVHVPHDRAGQRDAGDFRMTVVVRVRREGGDLEGLPDL